jgi:hypothetical protein
MQHHVETINEYHIFTKKLLLTTGCAVLLSSGISAFMQGALASFAPLFPAWIFPLVQIAAASVGLWWITKNGKKK